MDGNLPIALKILLLPVKGLVYIVKHPKLLIIVILLAVAYTAYGQFTSKDDSKTTAEIPSYQKILPSAVTAPRIVQTTSRYFPCSTFEDSPQYLTLTDYYVYDKDSWQHSTVPLPIEKSRIVQIYNR